MDSCARRRKSSMCGDKEIIIPHHYNIDPTSLSASLSMYIAQRYHRAMMCPLGRHLYVTNSDNFATSGAQWRFRIAQLYLSHQATASYLSISARSALVLRRISRAGSALQRDPHHGLVCAVQKIYPPCAGTRKLYPRTTTTSTRRRRVLPCRCISHVGTIGP